MRLVQPPPDPRAKYPQLPDAAARLTMRCMARKPAERFASVTEVASQLATLTLPAAAGSIHAPPPRAYAETSTPPGDKTVAVLPFRNGGPSDDEYLADGLTDDLIDNLSMTKGLRVRSRGVVMGLKGIDRDPRELGGSLGVAVVVEGSVRRSGERLRVNARVVSVSDGFQLWAKRFDCPASEFLAVGDEMVKAVALALTVESHAPVREVNASPVAMDLYLRARHRYFQGFASNLGAAIELFEQALSHSPDDPMILAAYAMALARQFSFVDVKDASKKGRAAAGRGQDRPGELDGRRGRPGRRRARGAAGPPVVAPAQRRAGSLRAHAGRGGRHRGGRGADPIGRRARAATARLALAARAHAPDAGRSRAGRRDLPGRA